MTPRPDSAHRSRKWWRAAGKTRSEARKHFLEQGKCALSQAAFSAFAEEVAYQRGDVTGAELYRDATTERLREAARYRRAAERCRPWWTRPRAAFREWSQGLFSSWSWRADDPGPTRPGVEP